MKLKEALNNRTATRKQLMQEIIILTDRQFNSLIQVISHATFEVISELSDLDKLEDFDRDQPNRFLSNQVNKIAIAGIIRLLSTANKQVLHGHHYTSDRQLTHIALNSYLDAIFYMSDFTKQVTKKEQEELQNTEFKEYIQSKQETLLSTCVTYLKYGKNRF